MKNPYLLLMVLALSSVFFMACETDETGEVESKSNALIPIRLGNRWTYKSTVYSSWQDQQILGVDTFSQMVIGPYTIAGVDYYSMYYTDANRNISTARFFTGNDENGNWVNCGAVWNGDTLMLNSITFKKNAAVGEIWATSDVRLYYEENSLKEVQSSVKCISTDTVISTSNGQFHCMLFESLPYDNSSSRAYVSSNIGIIRSELYRSDQLRSVNELIDYKLY